jgi:hypothetical protein
MAASAVSEWMDGPSVAFRSIGGLKWGYHKGTREKDKEAWCFTRTPFPIRVYLQIEPESWISVW